MSDYRYRGTATHSIDWKVMQPDAPAMNAPIRSSGRGLDRTIGFVAREWRRFLFGFLPVLGLGFVYLYAAPRLYTAEVTVMAAPRETDFADTDSVTGTNTGPREPDIDGELQLMTAPAALQRVVRSLHLEAEENAGIRGTPAAATNDVAAPRLELHTSTAIERITRNLKVAPVGRSTIVKIQFTDRSPALAASVANAVAENYIDARYRSKLEIAERAADYLHRRSAELQAEMIRSDRKLTEFRANSQARGRDLGQLKAEMDGLNERIVAATADREKAASRLAVAEERVRKNGLIALLAWEAPPGTNPYLDRLRGALAALRIRGAASEIGQESHGLESQLEAAGQSVLASMRMNLDAATGQVRSMEQSLQKIRQEVNAVEAEGVQLNALQSEATANQAVYENFANRWKATEQVGFDEARGWIVSRADMPLHPSSPKIPLILIGTLVAATGVGLSNALLKEYSGRRTIRCLDDVDAYLGPVRVLGAIPELRSKSRNASDVSGVSSGNDPILTEAVVGLYTSLSMAVENSSGASAGAVRSDEPAMVGFGQLVLVTSAMEAEGKSTTTAALAAAASSTGKRVAVVDCDLREPSLHTMFGLDLTPGVAECADGVVGFASALQRDAATGVWILPAGNIQEAPQRVLHSIGMARLLSQLRDSFDLVLLDAPPVLPVSDARKLAPLADHTVLVIAWSRTPWNASKLALRMLDEAGARLAGAVLTRINVSRVGAFEFPEAEIYRKPYSKYRRTHGRIPRLPNYADAEA